MKRINVNLFLDDYRIPYDSKIKGDVNAYHYTHYEKYKNEEWIIVRNYKEFTEFIENNGVPDFISFDHDLDDVHYLHNLDPDLPIDYEKYTEYTGFHCAKWLAEYCLENNIKFPNYYVHSMNNIGRINIIKYIENYKKHIENEKII